MKSMKNQKRNQNRKKNQNQKRKKSKRKRGGAPTPITYERVRRMVFNAFNRAMTNANQSREFVQQQAINAIVLETGTILLNSPEASQLTSSVDLIVGGLFELTLSLLNITFVATSHLSNTSFQIVSSLGTSVGSAFGSVLGNTILPGLMNAVASAINCFTQPVAGPLALVTTATTIALAYPQMKQGYDQMKNDGFLNTISYVLFNLMIRSGHFVEISESDSDTSSTGSYSTAASNASSLLSSTIKRISNTPANNDALAAIVQEIEEVASSQSSDGYNASQGSSISSLSSNETLPSQSSDMNGPNINLSDVSNLVDDMHAHISSLLGSRLASQVERDAILQSIQSDAEDYSQSCGRPSKRQATDSSRVGKNMSGGTKKRRYTKNNNKKTKKVNRRKRVH